jgi:hypothetical protein
VRRGGGGGGGGGGLAILIHAPAHSITSSPIPIPRQAVPWQAMLCLLVLTERALVWPFVCWLAGCVHSNDDCTTIHPHSFSASRKDFLTA